MIKRNRIKLKNQVVIYYMLASLGMVIMIGFILYYSISSIVLEEALSSTSMAVDKSGGHIAGYIDKVKDLTMIIAKNSTLQRYLTYGDGTDALDVMNLIETAIATDEDIASIIIVGKEGQLLSNETSLDMSMSDDMMRQSWYADVVGGDGMPALTSARMRPFIMDKDHWVISMSREIISEQGEHLGVVVVDFKYSFIDRYLEGLDLGDDGYLYILNGSDDVVYHPDTAYFESEELRQTLVEMSDMDQGYDHELNLLMHQTGVEGTDWRMYGIASLDGLKAIRRQVMESIVLVGFVGLFVVSGIGAYVAGRIVKPIRMLEDAMKDVDEGLEVIEVPEDGCYEVVSLTYHYNQMATRIHHLMIEVAQKEKAIRSYELNVLHSQINPHFLYNTLDTIIWMAEFGDSEKVIHLTKALARFFRLSLSGGSETTTVENELDHVRQYLIIQKERYEEQLAYTIEGAENTADLLIPKIILQPIVENSIYHGIRHKDGSGHIGIEVIEEKMDLVFRVSDDGVGFDVHGSIDKKTKGPKLGGVGIKNVDQRLKLTYGEDYGLTIESQPGVGTTVTVRVKKEGLKDSYGKKTEG